MQIKCNNFIFKSQKRFALSFYNFYAIGGHIVFFLSVILSSLKSATALTFHMNILCDKTLPWVPLFITL